MQPQDAKAGQAWKRLVRLGRKHLRSLRSRLTAAYHIGYRICYIVGIHTVRSLRAAGKRIVKLLVPIGRFFYKLADVLVLRHIRAMGREVRHMGQGFVLAAQRMKAAYRRHPLLTIPQALLLPFLALRRHRKAAFSLLNLAMPVAAAFVLVFTIQYWSNLTFALALDYDGQRLGYIRDEAVFDSAANMATERVINTDNSFEVQRSPKLTIAVAPKTAILDESTICDRILLSSADSIQQASGLYIEGKFEGAVANREDMDGLLDAILTKYKSGSGNERAEFMQQVEIVDGLYPIHSIVDRQQMSAYLTSETVVEKRYTVQKGDTVSGIAALHEMSISDLRAMNPGLNEFILIGQELLVQRAQPFLRVQVVRTIEYTEDVPFKTVKQQDTKQYVGYEKVKTQGQKGQNKIKAEVTLQDGVEQSRKILSTTAVKKPVDKVVIVGAKKFNNNVQVGDGVSTGRFIWPIPAGRVVSSSFGGSRRHQGVDLSGGVFNKPVLAADGGRVAEAVTGWGGGYGNYIIIDHGGGYRTVYAHLNSVNVVKNQTVTKGQMIGRAGSSGRSSGPHLHFEIRINGRAVNPLSYIK